MKKDPRRHVSSEQQKIEESTKDRVRIENNIYYRKSRERYYVVFYYGIEEETGKPIKKEKSFTSRKEARAARNAFEKEKTKGTVIIPRPDTLESYARKYIETKILAGREKSTISDYKKHIKHITAYKPFDGKPIQDITSDDLLSYFTYLMEDVGLSRNTCRKDFIFLGSVFRRCMDELIISRNPMRMLDIPKKEPTCAKFIPLDVFQKYLECSVGTAVEPILELLLLGLRREEIAGLRWENVDFDAECIYIKEVRTEVDGKVTVKAPKTDGSERTVYITPHTQELLKRIKKEQRKHNMKLKNMNLLYVIAKADGRPYKPNYLNSIMERFEKANGLPHYRMHDFRHTAASIGHEAGLDMYDVSKLLGHSSIRTTADLYMHQFDGTNKKAVTAITDKLYNAKQNDE